MLTVHRSHLGRRRIITWGGPLPSIKIQCNTYVGASPHIPKEHVDTFYLKPNVH